MYFATTLLLSLLSLNLAVSLPAPNPGDSDPTHGFVDNTKRAATAGWCTLHYNQYPGAESKLWVYGPQVNGVSPLFPGSFSFRGGGAFTILTGYGDMLVATEDSSNDVTFTRQGTVSGDMWTIAQTDEGDGLTHLCSVGKWSHGISRSMDCGFDCTPFTGPYAT